MSDQKPIPPSLPPTNGAAATAIQLRYIEKALDHLVETTVTKDQFQTVQKNIDELKATIAEKTASRWVERVVLALLISISGGFIAAVWALIQKG